jgi:hypothetical protein
MLVTAFRSPETTSALTDAISGSKLPALPLRFLASRFLCPFGFKLGRRNRFAPDSGRFFVSSPLQNRQPTRPVSPPASTPLRDSYIPLDQSVRLDSPPVGPPSGHARLPFAPHSRPLLLVFQLWINVPGSLRFRRLAVPQTSWNLLHYGPKFQFRQLFSRD